MKKHGFPKSEHLKRQKIFDSIFTKSESKLIHPILFKFIFTEKENRVSTKAAFIVSKKKAKKTSVRNLLKRRMREAYRQNKPIFESDSHQLNIVCMYISKDIENFESIEKAFKIFSKTNFDPNLYIG